VRAQEGSFYSNADDYVNAEFEFSSGLLGSMEVSWSIRNYRLPELSMEIHGRDGSLIVNDDFLKLYRDRETSGIVSGENQTFFKVSVNPSIEFLIGDPEYTLEDKEFLDSVEKGRKTSVDFRIATQVNGLIDLIHKEADN
jgi:predicted dehydrogenase